ncbi:DASH family cryptochrome [Limibacter armeniacum]|uniref:DASH family cryptochrome n=1 Tax=Limibacter armeniacum TaxID=466084 RepID=UPI002FE54029
MTEFKKIIYWFRNDLRIHDQPILSQLPSGTALLPVFCFDPRWFRMTKLGFPKTDTFRASFLIESVANLKESLIKLGSDLLITIGKPEDVIPKLAEKFEADIVFAQQEHTHEEENVEKKLSEKLPIPLALHEGLTLYHPDDVPFDIEKLPNIYTNFRKRIEKYAQVRECYPLPNMLPCFPASIEVGTLPTLSDFDLEVKYTDKRSVLQFEGGENSALERLEYYIWNKQLIKNYKNTRNGLLGDEYSSKLSAWLANGSISPRMIYWELQKYEEEKIKNESTYWLYFELLWRDYFRFAAMCYGCSIFQLGGIQGSFPEFKNSKAAFEKWKNGMTGISFVDANMMELKLTGFMSNRGRQNVASYLCKDLKVDWRWGAMWFESQLIDYDVCSNWGNWNYVAGVGNDPREDRYFNVPGQAKKYDPDGSYVSYWLEED